MARGGYTHVRTKIQRKGGTTKYKRGATHRPHKMIALKEHSFCRRFAFPALEITAGNTTILQSYSFYFSQLVNWSEYQGLFDICTLTGVKLTFIPSQNIAATGSNNVNAGLPTLFTCVDMTDSNVAANVDELREYGNCKVKYLSKPHTIYIKSPRMQTEIFRSALLTSYAMGKPNIWIATAGGPENIPHYGLKVAITRQLFSDINSHFICDVEAKYYFKCKTTR